ncbi:hypothetical protein BDW42DRAFT_202159 [Aspergillus taichungensis]|uniref:F-box domain-containing protein n=1 Tax=Aspergillus taichungensis TaxID=482145 RepID=A0A2J5HMQ5_9EURO|nr:hypothetical protein BDW42DRAFT_202159 [Aspergillus taichungensis]
MARGSLESLPLETLLQILELLNYEHPPSLLAVACTNKYCYRLTTPLLFRTIKIIYGGPRKLGIDVEGYTEMLSRSASFRHVRRLLICNVDHDRNCGLELDHKWQWPKTSRVERGQSEDSIFELHNRTPLVGGIAQPIKDINKMDKCWNPLANLLKRLPGLTDLVFTCDDLLPPCILETLNHYRPQCRLQVNLSSLPCLHGHPVHPHELALLRSECLHAIMISHEEENWDSSDETTRFHADAIQQLVGGVAPNLREVYVRFNHAVRHSGTQSGLNSPKRLDLRNNGQMLAQRPLICLQFGRGHLVTKDWMEYWAVSTDFSSLNILKLWSPAEEDTLNYLIVNHKFRSLHTLLLVMSPVFSPRMSERHHDGVARFLLSLPRLSNLTLREWRHDLLLNAAIPYHGSKLRKLSISSLDDESLTLENVKQLPTSCPLLEVLELPLRRSKGDSTEVMTYQTLGSLPALRYLGLTLGASNRSVLDCGVNSEGEPMIPDDPTFDEFDRTFFTGDQFSRPEMYYHGIPRFPRNGHIRDSLVNSALDQTLARDIFRAVSSGKTPSSKPLERLTLAVKGAGDLGGDPQLLAGLTELASLLNRRFTVERNLRDDHRDDLIIRRSRKATQSGIYSADANIMPYEDIFCRIWPVSRRHRKQWWTRWHGLPLAELPTSGDDS